MAYNENEAGDIVLWDVRAQSVIRRLPGHQWYVTALAFSPDGKLFASGGADRTVKLWNVAERRELVTFTNYTDMLRGVAFSPDGKMLACTWGQRVTLLDVTTRTEIVQFRGHQSRATGLAFTPDGRTLITGGGTGMVPGGDGSVRVWDVTARPKETDSQRFQTAIGQFSGGSSAALCLSPDGNYLLSVFADKTFSVWETQALSENRRRPSPLTQFASTALAPGGTIVAWVAEDGNIFFWHADTGETNWFAHPTTNSSTRAVFSADGTRLAIGGVREVCVMDVASKTKLHCFPLSEEASVELFPTVMSLAFSRDGQRLMAGFDSGLVKVWDLRRRIPEVTLRGHDWQVTGVGLLPDDRTLVSTSREVRFWDLTSQRELFLPLLSRLTQFYGCSISPDGRRLAVGERDGLITIWDLASRQEVATLKADERRVVDLAFLSDGNTLVSAGLTQLGVWRAASFEETDREDLKK